MKLFLILNIVVLAANAMEREQVIAGETPEQQCSTTCRDQWLGCGHNIMVAACEYTNYVGAIVRSKCALSCGACRVCPVDESARSCAEEETCKDTNVYCAQYLAPVYCKNHALSFLVKKVCKKSCGLCPVRTCGRSSVQQPCSADCEDLDIECAYWSQEMNYCSASSIYKDWMERRCRQSCRLCRKCGEGELAVPPEASVQGELVAPSRPPATNAPTASMSTSEPTTTTLPSTELPTETIQTEVETIVIDTLPSEMLPPQVTNLRGGCQIECQNGTCNGLARRSICVCDHSAPGVVSPRCGSRCEANCIKPTGFTGQWSDNCTGEIVCTCHPTGDPGTGVPAGAVCR